MGEAAVAAPEIRITPEEFERDGLSPQEQVMLRRQVTQRFRGGMTPYLSALVKTSDAVRRQFVPEFYEGLAFGREAVFEEGKDNRGIYGLERVYEDRAVLTPYFDCAAYCRYCFKKTRTLAGNGKVMSPENIRDALAYIASDPRIDTALITGGDPLARPDMLETLLDGLAEIDHVKKIRVGTRHILFDPGQVTDDMCAMLARYNHVRVTKAGWTGRSLSIGVSLNHPDELAPEVAEALQRLMRAGIAIRGQVVLLKGINDDAATLRELLERFVLLGIVPYYLFHCMDVVGTYHLRTSIQKGLDLTAALAARSGVYALTYVCVTPVGKVRLGPGTPLDYNDIEGRRYLQRVTPYRAADFHEFSGRNQLPAHHWVNEAGYIVTNYLDGNDDPVP